MPNIEEKTINIDKNIEIKYYYIMLTNKLELVGKMILHEEKPLLFIDNPLVIENGIMTKNIYMGDIISIHTTNIIIINELSDEHIEEYNKSVKFYLDETDININIVH